MRISDFINPATSVAVSHTMNGDLTDYFIGIGRDSESAKEPAEVYLVGHGNYIRALYRCQYLLRKLCHSSKVTFDVHG